MTTAETGTKPSLETPARESSAPLGLRALAEALAAFERLPPLGELNALLRRVEPSREELRPYVGFKMGTYARHRVFRSDFVELLVLCWRPGQRTPIHDHNGSYGAVRVCQGVLWETMFTLDRARGLAYHSAREWGPGHVTGADVPDIHQLGNPDVSGQDLITLHMYAPPLTTINTFRVGRTESVNTLSMDSWNPTV